MLHLAQGIIVGKAGLILCNFLELPVQSLDNICLVYGLLNFCRVFKEDANNLPVFLPALDTGEKLFLVDIPKLVLVLLCLVQGDSSIDFLQTCDRLLDVLIADIFGVAVELMDGTALHAALGKHRLDG